MKKLYKIIITVTVFAFAFSLLFCSCQKNEQPTDEGIVVSFVTGYEDENVRIQPIVIKLDAPGSLPEEPIYAGYEFTGWYYDEQRSNKFSTSDPLTHDTVLYAGWKLKRANTEQTEESRETVAENGIVYTKTENDEYKVISYIQAEENVTEIIVPATYLGYTVTEIGEKAFGNYVYTEKIILPKTVKTIEKDAFSGLTSLTEISVSSENEAYESTDGILYSKSHTELVAVGRGLKGDFVLPKKIKKIGEYAFYGCTFNVTIPADSVLTVIDSYAFAGFEGDLTLSENVSEIRKKAFYEGKGNIIFPDNCGVQALLNGEFDGYAGEKLILPSSVQAISGSPFYGMTAEIDLTATGIKTLGASALAGYAGAKFVVPYFVENIEENCFYRCTSKVTFDERVDYQTVKELSFNQFAGEVIFPTTVRNVEKNAFYAARYARITFCCNKSELDIEENAFNLCPETNVYYLK